MFYQSQARRTQEMLGSIRQGKPSFVLLFIVRIFNHRVHRVVTSALWRTFSHDGKLVLLHLPSLVKLQCTWYTPAEWADTLTLFHLL
jgi:hypothetical protein